MLVRKKQGDNCELFDESYFDWPCLRYYRNRIGGLAAFFVKGINRRFLSFILELSAGLMTSVVCFETCSGGIYLRRKRSAFAGVFAGVLAMLVVEDLMMRYQGTKPLKSDSSLLRTGILTAVGIALHNFPRALP